MPNNEDFIERNAEPDLEAWLADQPLSYTVAQQITATQASVNSLTDLVLELHAKIDAIRSTQLETEDDDDMKAAIGLAKACRSALSDHANGG